eukprot:gnl/MRDRNA2_/MRDRNA2_123805_c0_seq1.p1 gnl/MRDRNA2_/MRDRNA2_123805_c0~~gnl/MRDRNA2_/MRDRNA2_123805_c0_seq1.p1  ORF type:complete len:1154 (-),score=244.37 gnl/MRDRNA2_/MRDRNA2_123805_c0_seq1:90-3503(-)
MQGQTTTVTQDKTPKNFTYDFSYWSFNPGDSNFASQDLVHADIGSVVIQNALNGFNGCLFAYGQTGAGKSYSVVGYPDAPGIIPRSVEEIFKRKGELEKQQCEPGKEKEIRIWISFVEIYNEQVRDLLHASDDHDHAELKVMDHPKFGVYIPGLTEAACGAPADVTKLMDFGTKKRVVAATQMNATSSRSHAVFTVKVQYLEGPPPDDPKKEDPRKALNAKINLVDLAGSERQSKTGAEGATLKEGCAINQSLSALGMVIKELSESAGKKGATVPFRASKLTFLLKNSLSGNSKTYMIAAISPASDNVEETISTLRFASSVKQIKTVATQNKDKKDELIEHLKAEIDKLKHSIATGEPLALESTGASGQVDKHEELEERKRLLDHMGTSYEEQLEHNQKMDELRSRAMAEHGLSQDDINQSFGADKGTPFFLNMADDPLLAGCLLYFVEHGQCLYCGSGDECGIKLKGAGIPEKLCKIENENNELIFIERCTEEGRLVLNGRLLKMGVRTQMNHGDKIFLGRAYALKLQLPLDPKATKPKEEHLTLEGLSDEIAALEESPSWVSLQMYLDSIIQQMDRAEGERLFSEVRESCKLCDEANEMTAECRGEEELRFEVDVTTSIPTSAVVCVWVHNEEGEGWRQKYFWSRAQMAERLESIRDHYEEWHRNGTMTIDVLLDPWSETKHADVKERLGELELALLESNEENARLKYQKFNMQMKTLNLWESEKKSGDLLRLYFQSWTNQVATSSKSVKKSKGIIAKAAASRSVTLGRAKASSASAQAGRKSEPVPKPKSRATSKTPGRPSETVEEPKALMDAPEPQAQEENQAQEETQAASPKQVVVDSKKPEIKEFRLAESTAVDTFDRSDLNRSTGSETDLSSQVLVLGERVEVLTTESEGLRKELEAAWQLVRTLQAKVKMQEDLREKDHDEVQRLRSHVGDLSHETVNGGIQVRTVPPKNGGVQTAATAGLQKKVQHQGDMQQVQPRSPPDQQFTPRGPMPAFGGRSPSPTSIVRHEAVPSLRPPMQPVPMVYANSQQGYNQQGFLPKEVGYGSSSQTQVLTPRQASNPTPRQAASNGYPPPVRYASNQFVEQLPQERSRPRSISPAPVNDARRFVVQGSVSGASTPGMTTQLYGAGHL